VTSEFIFITVTVPVQKQNYEMGTTLDSVVDHL